MERNDELIDLLFETGAFSPRPRKLRSGGNSPYYIDFGKISDGKSLDKLGSIYAEEVFENFDCNDFDTIFGPAYKGYSLAVLTTAALWRDYGINKRSASNRKEEKDHGEKGIMLGEIRDGDRVVLLDDVISMGGSLYNAIEVIDKVVEVEYVGALVGVDLQRLSGLDGARAVFEERKGMPLHPVCRITEFFERDWGDNKSYKPDCVDWLRNYGTEEAKSGLVEFG